MFNWTFGFLIITLIAALVGFTGIAGVVVEMARILFFVFLIVWILALGFVWYKNKKN